MEPKSQPLTADKSFEIINEMIQKAKNSFSKVSFYFLLWGVLLFIAGIAEYYLAQVAHYQYYFIGWPIAGLLGGIIATIYGAREGKKQGGTSTFLDKVFGMLWSAFTVTLVLVIVGAVASKQNPGPFIIVLTGLPTFVSGSLMRFTPFVIGGILFWAIGIAAFFLPTEYRSLAFSLAIVVGYIIPGLMLKKPKMQFKELDPLLHSQLRLAIISLLVSVEKAEFNFLMEKTKATAGNLSIQLKKLNDAKYIEVTKQFRDNYPLTTCKITSKGITAFEKYVEALKGYIDRK